MQDRELQRRAQECYALAQAKAITASRDPKAHETISFAKWASWFETHHLAHHRGAKNERSMLSRLRVHFDRFTAIHEIDEDAVREWMTARKGEVSKATVNRELDVLKSLLRAAVPKYIATIPLGNVRRFRLEEREPRILTDDEEARILAVATPHDRAFVILALDTLLRLSNVVNLKWAQVKLDAKAIIPLNAKVSTDAKPMSVRLLQAFRELPHRGEFVFWQFHEGPRTMGRQMAMRRFEALCKLADVPHGRSINGVTFHCLRHTGATRALQRGASLRTVMKLGGWKHSQTVLRYLHVSDADVIAAAESIGARHAHVEAKSDESGQNSDQ